MTTDATPWRDLSIATMADGTLSYGEPRDSAMVIEAGRIAWAGPRDQFSDRHRALPTRKGGGWMTPGLVYCHVQVI